MSKLVGEDVPSLEQFMARYRVGTTDGLARRFLFTSYDFNRWIIQLHYTVLKWAFPQP
jgi:hypothetical protein